MKIERVRPEDNLCKGGDFIYSNDSDITYMIAETKEGFILIDIKTGMESYRASNIPDLLEFMRTVNKVIIPSLDATIILKSNNW